MKKITSRKMSGVYYHDLIAHGGDMLRIVSGRSANAEEERHFHIIKAITKKTSNYNESQLVPNVLLRVQAQARTKDNNAAQKQQSNIKIVSESLKPAHNTCIPLTIIRKYSREWQAHMIKISDFLLQGKEVWWKQHANYVEFYDVTSQPAATTGPQPHHFMSSNINNEQAWQRKYWEKCLAQQDLIPANIVRIDQEDGTTKFINMANLVPTQTSTNGNIEKLSRPSGDSNQDIDSQTEYENTDIQIVPAADEIVNLNE